MSGQNELPYKHSAARLYNQNQTEFLTKMFQTDPKYFGSVTNKYLIDCIISYDKIGLLNYLIVIILYLNEIYNSKHRYHKNNLLLNKIIA